MKRSDWISGSGFGARYWIGLEVLNRKGDIGLEKGDWIWFERLGRNRDIGLEDGCRYLI